MLLLLFAHTLGEADGSRWAHQTAEMAAHTLRSYDAGLTGGRVEGYGLVSAVRRSMFISSDLPKHRGRIKKK